MSAPNPSYLPDPEPTVTVDNLTFCYGSNRVLHGLSFALGKGDVVGLLGPNGAGKSTTIKVLTGVLPPDEGSVRVADYSMPGEAHGDAGRFRVPNSAKPETGCGATIPRLRPTENGVDRNRHEVHIYNGGRHLVVDGVHDRLRAGNGGRGRQGPGSMAWVLEIPS